MKKFTITFILLVAVLSLNAQYKFDKILYGAAYYHEYVPEERLDKDIQMMKDANLSVVRVGESSWGLFEPREGVFEFEWMDRIIDSMHKAGIKVILGTPTYSIPAWMAEKHPEVLSERINNNKSAYGIRQNMNFYSPTYRFYSERIIRKMMEHYAKHPAIIGYQVDNETEARGVNNHDYFVGFRNYVKDKFGGSIEKMTKEWGMNYWGMNIHTWEEFYTRDGVTNPSYLLEWERWNRKAVADFLNWQIDIVNEYKRKDQFIMHCFMPAFHNIDQVESFRQMQYPAINIYHDVQDNQDGRQIAFSGDFMRSVSNSGNYLVTETNAQATGWSSTGQYPPYDMQLRQNMYSHLASGANLVEYWHWATLHYGQETYWKGVIGHDQQPNRISKEFGIAAKEIEKIGKNILNLKKDNKTAILYSHDSYFGLRFMPYTRKDNYPASMMHKMLYELNIETDIIPCDSRSDFSGYNMLVIPPLYVASDELLLKIDEFVKNGGHVVMMFKSAYCNEYSAVRNTLAPGPLRKACGFYYQEYSTIAPMKLKSDKLKLSEGEHISEWYEFLITETAKPIAYADHHFFGQWPAITENNYGKGKLTYIGAYPSEELLKKVLLNAAEEAKVTTPASSFRFPVIFRSGTNDLGKSVTYIFNYSGEAKSVNYPYPSGKDLISGKSIVKGEELTIAPWCLAIVEGN